LRNRSTLANLEFELSVDRPVKGVRLPLDLVTSLMLAIEGRSNMGSFYKRGSTLVSRRGQEVLFRLLYMILIASKLQGVGGLATSQIGSVPQLILIARITTFPGEPMHMHRRKRKHVVATFLDLSQGRVCKSVRDGSI